MTVEPVVVLPMVEDWPEIAAIYKQGIATGHATFETEPPPTWDAVASTRLLDHCHVAIDVHERAGFRVVGTRQRLGRMARGPLAGQWRDVTLVERRRAATGA